jgi:four helix bundle protein
LGDRRWELVIAKNNLNSFEDLEVWQQSQLLAVDVYKITKTFPKEEMFGITNQLRRAVSSVSANIAEGFGRATVKDKLHFLSIAYGSLLETKNFIYLAERLEYINSDDAEKILTRTVTCQKLLNGFRRSLQS